MNPSAMVGNCVTPLQVDYNHTIFPFCQSLVAQWLNCCTAAKTVLTTRGSIPSSWLKLDSAFYPSEVSKMSTQLTGGGEAMCSLHN